MGRGGVVETRALDLKRRKRRRVRKGEAIEEEDEQLKEEEEEETKTVPFLCEVAAAASRWLSGCSFVILVASL